VTGGKVDPGESEILNGIERNLLMNISIRMTSILMVLALFLVSCTKPDVENSGKTGGESIAVFTKNQTNPYFQTVRLGAENAARQMNAAVVQYIPTVSDSITEQLSEIEDAIIKRPGAVVFIPVNSKAMIPGIEKLNAAGIPVVNVTDRVLGGQIVSFMGCDETKLAVNTGRFLLQKMNGRGNVVILEGRGGSENSVNRVAGYRKALEEFPNVRLLASQPADFQRVQALQVTENLLQSYPQIDGILAANDSMALGAIEALDAARRKSLVVGINGTLEAIDAIKAGKLLATGDCDGFRHGCLGTMAAVRHLRNLPVPKEFIFSLTVIDSTNYAGMDVPYEQRMCPKWESVVKDK
jgi:ribose transport system substrate-binding protein